METSARPMLSATMLAVRVLLPFAAGYFLSYLFRTVNAVLAPISAAPSIWMPAISG
ncbi:MAG: hypothetical protein NVV74_17955 [Magnetospirillum sp.]|nr:hypothetical protein [Magnetospirillum sp.]